MLLLGHFCVVQAYSAGQVDGAWLHTMCLMFIKEWLSCLDSGWPPHCLRVFTNPWLFRLIRVTHEKRLSNIMILLIIKLIRQVALSLYMAKDIISKHHYSKGACIHKVPKVGLCYWHNIKVIFFSLPGFWPSHKLWCFENSVKLYKAEQSQRSWRI